MLVLNGYISVQSNLQQHNHTSLQGYILIQFFCTTKKALQLGYLEVIVMSRQSRKVPILIVRRIKVLSTELRAKSQVILSFDEQLFFALHRRSLPDPIQHSKLWIFHYNSHLKNITLGSETKKKKCECCHPKCCDCLCQKLETSVHAGATMLALFAFDSLQPCSLHLAL